MPLTSSDAFFTIDADDILGFNVDIKLAGGSTATLRLSNRGDKYSPDDNDLLGQVTEITAVYDGVSYVVFTGIIKNVNVMKDGIGGSIAELGVAPIVEGLAKRPVTTQQFTTTTGTDLMTEVLGAYGSLPAEYFDVSEDNAETFSNVIIADDSLLHAVRQLAQACNVEMFVTADGKLVTAAIKDVDSATEATLSLQYIKTYDINASDLELISAVKVAGRFVSALEDGEEYKFPVTTFSVMNVLQNSVRMKFTPPEPLTEQQALALKITDLTGADRAYVTGVDPKTGDIIIRDRKSVV